MPTLTCQQIVTNARRLLRDNDPDGDFAHSDEVLLGWLTEGYTDMVILKPSVNTVIETFQLQPGVEQTLPDGGVIPIRGISNMGADGAIRGNVFTLADSKALYRGFPDWMLHTADGSVQHVLPSPTPTSFQVYPPQPDPAHFVALEYSAIPAEPADINALISVDDEYAPALTNYIVHRALSEDSDHPANREKATMFHEKYLQLLGAKAQQEMASSRRTS
ncbi:DUF6682 family protein [Endozoicomonas ascidiicola]|uniref:phage adaptor protein n=1 Tax=Endozoicomonas ascidiicola TaxID=1698521 RepID=UPI0008332D6C|nr:DUF6682 family protein [Endozoicomonas ascidiicola]